MCALCTRHCSGCRPLWSLFIFLAMACCTVSCSHSPAAAKGKMFPRGNHWAVGHLMGKKSIERLSEKLEVRSDQLTPSDLSVAVELDQCQGLVKALMLQKIHQKVMPRSADWPHRKRSSWREEDRDKYLREMSQLLLLAFKMQKDSG